MAATVPTFVPHKSCYWLPNQGAASPFISDIVFQGTGELVFDGYFHIEDGANPFERVVYSKNGSSEGYFHLRFIAKQTLADTSSNKQQDDPNEPRYVPSGIKTNIIRMYYQVLAANLSYEAALQISNEIKDLGFCDHVCGGRGGDGYGCEKAERVE